MIIAVFYVDDCFFFFFSFPLIVIRRSFLSWTVIGRCPVREFGFYLPPNQSLVGSISETSREWWAKHCLARLDLAGLYGSFLLVTERRMCVLCATEFVLLSWILIASWNLTPPRAWIPSTSFYWICLPTPSKKTHANLPREGHWGTSICQLRRYFLIIHGICLKTTGWPVLSSSKLCCSFKSGNIYLRNARMPDA